MYRTFFHIIYNYDTVSINHNDFLDNNFSTFRTL